MKSLLRLPRAAAALPFLLLLSACLSDPIDRPEVKPRVVTPPPRAWFFATNYQPPVTGDLVVRWNHAPSDTQQNFKGYYIKLYTSYVDSLNENHLETLLQTESVLKVGNKVDTTIAFHNIPMRGDATPQYSIVLFGMKFADTLALSTDSLTVHNVFDPRPLLNPRTIRATSLNRQDVRLEWDTLQTEDNIGFAGYQVYYRAADTTAGFIRGPLVGRIPGNKTLQATIGGLPGLVRDQVVQPERAYVFWVKAVRVDSAEFFDDSATITWAGAARVPAIQDSNGFRHSLFFGVNTQGPILLDDSTDNAGQVQLEFNGTSVTLRAANGASFNDRRDEASSLDTVTYDAPITTGFGVTSVTIDHLSDGADGIILYLEIPKSPNKQYARIWIKRQAEESVVTARNGIYIQASYQTGTSKQGDPYPYY